MYPKARWNFNPFDSIQPIKQQTNLSRSRSLNQLDNQQISRPSSDRICSSVPYPIVHKLRIDELFDFHHGEQVNIDLLIHHLKNEGRLAEPAWRHLLTQSLALFRQEPNIINLPRGCTIVGDIHGQFYDLLQIFEIGGPIGEQPYVFLGDYVDRGSFSCECLFLLLSLKLNHPRSIILLRGNHESRQMTQMFTYKNECRVKYSDELWYQSMILFDSLPICALIDHRFLCMHGGISPFIRTLQDINQINRFQEIPMDGSLCDLMWSDPNRKFIDRQTPPWLFNHIRNCSFLFNYKACEHFLIENHLLSIIRAHEVVPNGLIFYDQSSISQFPVLISLFSAPNYCDIYKNTAAILIYDHQRNLRPIYFQHRPHPFVLPNHENAFQFAHRFMKTYVQEILLALIQGYTKSIHHSSNQQNDQTTKQLKIKEKFLSQRTNQSRKMNQMNIQLANLTPSEQLQDKAFNNQQIFEDETITLTKSSIENDSQLTFEAASKIDALYEQRIY